MQFFSPQKMENSQVAYSQYSMMTNQTVDEYFATTKKTLDPIHGFVNFDADIWNFVDTPEFQRLRDIKQLGGVYYVFPSATHTRFEHCLGTGHLAQKLIKSLYKHQATVVAEFDSAEYAGKIKKNVTLAGLLHDLGHGPFSHLFDGKIIPKVAPGSQWSHEQGSSMLLKKLVDDNNIDIEQEDVHMISALILGQREDPKYADKTWIFDIVANSKNSIDVDKYDYMTRDSFHLGLKDTNFDYRSLIKESRVINDEICFPAKQCHKVYELFQVRYKLYKEIYHNRAAKAVELMLTEILLNANEHYHFDKIIEDPEAYLNLTDFILKEIELSKDPSLEKSRQILKRLKKREIYKFASETLVDTNWKVESEERMINDILSCSVNDGTDRSLTFDDIRIVTATNTYGLKDKNPVESVHFYNKNNIKKSFCIDKEQVSLLLPGKFSERFIRVYTSDDNKVDTLRRAFNIYCKTVLNTEMGPVESKGVQEFDFKSKRSNTSEMGAYEPDINKRFLLEDRKYFLQVSKPSPNK